VNWRAILKTNFTSVEALADFLELPPSAREELLLAPAFRLNLPRRLAAKIPKGTLNHPLARQFVPLRQEQLRAEGWMADPVEDSRFQKTPRLLHKYPGRVLLVTTGACAMHCRYCFRQNYDYPPVGSLSQELHAIAADLSIREVILSGGDPLSLSDARLEQLVHALAEIPHLKRLRLHTRFPIGIPERLTDDLIRILAETRLQTWLVIHCNHPLELDEEVCASLNRVHRGGIPVLNQAVLLAGVNDDLETQVALCERLVDHGILPYYLHQLDRVEGAQHFEVQPSHGLALIQAMRERLSGYAVPNFVQEVPGHASKTPVASLLGG
jgi:EF-P beta-lysylation protein EpmB